MPAYDADAILGLSVVRIHQPCGAVLGTGLLVADSVVLTCAPMPVDEPTVAFPLLAGEHRIQASITRRAQHGDFVVLGLAEPAPESARIAPVLRVSEPEGRRCRLLGFPGDTAGGTWLGGRFVAADGDRPCWQGATAEDQPRPGFGGAPAWDVAAAAVIGLVRTRTPEETAAELVPIADLLGAEPALVPNPYRGLLPFREEHAACFAGRDAEVERVLAALDESPIVAVTGRSGVGKSSLLHAAVTPRLRAEGLAVGACRVPATAVAVVPILAGLFAAADGAAPSEVVREGLSGRLAGLLGGAAVDDLAAELRERVPAAGLVLVLDEAEELAATRPQDARELLRLLGALIEMCTVDGQRRLRVLLTLRWEAMNELLTGSPGALPGNAIVALAPMGRDQLREVLLHQQARAPGLRCESGLLERILQDADQLPAGLARLELLLSLLFLHREDNELRVADYARLGGVRGVVTSFAEGVWDRLAETGDQPAARRLLCRLARTPQDGGVPVSVAVGLDALPGELRRVTGVLAAHGLVLLDDDVPSGRRGVELTHQVLIEHWPRLSDWLREERSLQLWQEELDRGGEPAPAVPVRAAGERPRRGDRDARRWRAGVVLLAVLLLIAGAGGAALVRSNAGLAASLDAANAGALGRTAIDRLAGTPDTAAQLAVAAYRADPSNPVARTALGRAYLAELSASKVFSGVSDRLVTSFEVATRAAAVLLPTGTGFAVLTGIDGERPRSWRLPGLSSTALTAISPYGRRVVALQGNRLLSWDVRDRTGPTTLTTVDDSSGAGTRPRFSSDGRRLAWWTPRDGLRLWDLVANQPIQHQVDTQVGVPVTEAWPTDNPDTVVLRYGADPAGANSRIVVREVNSGQRIRLLPATDAIAANGNLTVHCEPGQQPSDDNNFAETNAVITVSTTADGAQASRFPGQSAVDCSTARHRLSQDREYLLTASGTRGAQNTLIRMTSLREGTEYEFAAPPGAIGPDAAQQSGDWRIQPTLAVRPGPTPLLGMGTALLRFDGPLPRTPGGRGLEIVAPTEDGRYYLAQRTSTSERAFVVVDRRTGAEVASLPQRALPVGTTWRQVLQDKFVLAVRAADGGMTALVYQLPTLRRLGWYELPAATGTSAGAEVDQPDFAIVDGQLLAMYGARLSVWELDTGEQEAEPVTLADAPAEAGWLRGGGATFVPRPQYPTQVAVPTRTGAIQLWNVHTGRLITTLPTRLRTGPDAAYTRQFAIDPTGAYLVLRDARGLLDVWDLEQRRRARQPIEVADPHELLGFSAAGELVLSTGQGTRHLLLNIHNGARTGPFAPDGQGPAGEALRGGNWLSTGSDSTLGFPLDAQRWLAHLCAVQDRGYRAAELALLPPGADTTPPCE